MKTPAYCLVCGAEYSGGTAWEGDPLPPERRVFYRCGSSLSYEIISPGIYKILVKNCGNDETVSTFSTFRKKVIEKIPLKMEVKKNADKISER